MINAQIVPATAEHIAEIIPACAGRHRRVCRHEWLECCPCSGVRPSHINLLLCRLDKRPRCHRLWRGARFNDWRQRDPGLSARMIWSAISAHFCAAAGRWLLQCCPSIRISKIMSMPVTTSQKRGCTGSVLPGRPGAVWRARTAVPPLLHGEKLMCEPATIAAGATLVIGAMSAYSQHQQGKYARAVANQNADIAETQAQDAVNRGNIQAEEVRRRSRQAAGTQAATMGATGADLSSGTSLDIFGDTAQFGTLDALTTVNNAQREAYGYRVQGMNAIAEGNAAKVSPTLL